MIPNSSVQRSAFRIIPIFLAFLFLSPAFSIAKEPMTVFVSILPQKHFVERIGGDRVSVQVMVSPGASPATYEPKPRQMAAISKARLYFAVGAPFESVWLDRIASTNPEMNIVRTQDGIEKRAMAAHHHGHGDDSDHGHGHDHSADDSHQGHDHGDHADHDHANHGHAEKGHERDHHGHAAHSEEKEAGGIPDPHIWLSPPLVMQQARNILDALAEADPDGRSDYATRYREFISEVVDVDLYLMKKFAAPDAKGQFMVYHPSWGYFADAYGLTQIPVELEGKAPKPAQLQGLIERAREDGVRIVFVQPQFSKRSAETIAKAIDGEVVEVDPLAENWGENLRSVADHFASAVR
jgi:zinc transport system substrate-binding protein